MVNRVSRTSVNLDISAGTQPTHGVPEAETPFRILIIGDFSGCGPGGERAPLAGRRPKAVDCDNLDEVLASLSPSVHLPEATLRFRALDDFHPDHIYRHTDLFRKLADLRKQAVPVLPTEQKEPDPIAPAGPISGRGLLEDMLQEADERPASRAQERDALAAFLQKTVEPHLVPRGDPRQQEWAARVDSAAGGRMRAILHHPHFQSLEAAWRAVALLVNRLQPDAELKLYVFDATLEELMADPASVERCFGGSQDPWALIVGNFAFGQTAKDAGRLRWLGQLAAALGAPFLAEAAPPSDPNPNPPWRELVRSAEARWLGLALPRFLLRLPYGKETSPAEEFGFEEMPESVHTHYLWAARPSSVPASSVSPFAATAGNSVPGATGRSADYRCTSTARTANPSPNPAPKCS